MLESVGPLGYVIRKLNQVRENGPFSQSRFEAIEIIEALILALVAVATAWSGYQAAQWAGNVHSSTPKRVGSELQLKGLPPWQDRSGSTTAIPSTAGSPPRWMVKSRRRVSSSGAFAASIDRPLQPGSGRILLTMGKPQLA